jgi:hypothetical protein
VLTFPQELTVQLVTGDGPTAEPFACPDIALSIRTRPVAKHRYSLGPFFTDSTGRAVITAAACEALAAAELSTGLMDYEAVHRGGPTVDLVCWTGEDVSAALQARTEVWTRTLPGEEAVHGTVDQLIARLRSARNRSVTSRPLPLDWGRPLGRTSVDLRVTPSPSAGA